MFATLANFPPGNPKYRRECIFMASQNSTSKKAGTTKAKSGAKQAKSGVKQAANAEKNQAQSVAEAAIDLPVGAVLRVTDRVGELVEPFTSRDTAERKVKSYRTELRRSLKRTERRGSTARRKATSEARKT